MRTANAQISLRTSAYRIVEYSRTCEQQHETPLRLLTQASKADLNQLAHSHSVISLCYLHDETFHRWLIQMRPVKILSGWADAQVGLRLRCTHMLAQTYLRIRLARSLLYRVDSKPFIIIWDFSDLSGTFVLVKAQKLLFLQQCPNIIWSHHENMPI